jgi:hypothetical protein
VTFLRRFQTIFKKLKVIHSSPMATAISLVYLKLSFAFEIGITIYGSRQFQLFLNENYHDVLYLRFAALHEMYNFDIEHEERNRKAIKPSLASVTNVRHCVIIC